LAPLKSPSGDPIAELLGKSAYIPDMGSGISLSTTHFHVGLSVMQLFQSPIKFGEVRVNAKELQHIRKYSLYSYYNKQLANEDWQIEPSVFIRGDEHLQFGADFSSRLIYQHSYWAGLSFRTSGEFILLLGLKMNRVYFGYSFDYGFNQISRLTYGSHEVVLALKLGDSTRRYRWHERY
jgi:type IX secretion system PorP/SprF family membrane protein